MLLGLKRASNRAPAHLAAELRSLRDSTRISLEELRRIAGRLRPGLLEDLGLISSLNALATGFAPTRGTGLARLRASLPRLSGETELVIYRVTQASPTSPGTPGVHSPAEPFSSGPGVPADSGRRRRHP